MRMKMQIAFDIIDLDAAIRIASDIQQYVDIFEVSTLLLHRHGIEAVKQFKKTFPQKTILADTKIIDNGKDITTLFASAQPDWITVMAGTNKNVIHTTCTTANNHNIKVMLDLLDTNSSAQSALEAKNLGAHALLLHQDTSEPDSLTFFDKWEMVRGNTDLPIFIAAPIKRDTIAEYLSIRPDGIVIGKSIVESSNPKEEAHYFYELINKLTF